MRHLYLSFLLLTTSVFALPIGNPADTYYLNCSEGCDCKGFLWQKLHPRVGFYGDYVFNRNLKSRDDPVKHIEKTTVMTNAAYFNVNFFELFDLFATVGATRIRLTGNTSSLFGVEPGVRAELVTNSSLSGSIGARKVFYSCKCLMFGGEAQYFTTRPHFSRATVGEIASLYPDPILRLRYQEWQGGLTLSYCFIDRISPYMGVKWSKILANSGDALLIARPLLTFVSDKRIGYAVGVSILDCNYMAVNVEGRFGDEKAFYVNATVRF